MARTQRAHCMPRNMCRQPVSAPLVRLPLQPRSAQPRTVAYVTLLVPGSRACVSIE